MSGLGEKINKLESAFSRILPKSRRLAIIQFETEAERLFEIERVKAENSGDDIDILEIEFVSPPDYDQIMNEI